MQKLYNLFHSFVGPLIEIVCVVTQWTHNTPPLRDIAKPEQEGEWMAAGGAVHLTRE